MIKTKHIIENIIEKVEQKVEIKYLLLVAFILMIINATIIYRTIEQSIPFNGNQQCAFVYDENGDKTNKILCVGSDGYLHEKNN